MDFFQLELMTKDIKVILPAWLETSCTIHCCGIFILPILHEVSMSEFKYTCVSRCTSFCMRTGLMSNDFIKLQHCLLHQGRGKNRL